jgi:hypothetical protein
MQGCRKEEERKESREQKSCPSDFFIFYVKSKSEIVILDNALVFSKVGSVIFDKVTKKPMNSVKKTDGRKFSR